MKELVRGKENEVEAVQKQITRIKDSAAESLSKSQKSVEILKKEAEELQ
jgi:hypothetical protein